MCELVFGVCFACIVLYCVCACVCRSARAGYKDAAFVVGWRYHSGEVVAKDYAQARVFYEMAAVANHAAAAFNLGTMFELGQGCDVDRERALTQYRKGAAVGYEDALKRLKELGVPYVAPPVRAPRASASASH